ncbi:MAG: DNA-directed RNA polymerase subunit alpha C-terminal domain-containing protein [Bacillota bacterium]
MKCLLMQLLTAGFPLAIILSYLGISSSTLNTYIKKLRASGEWEGQVISFLRSIPAVVRTYEQLRRNKISLEGIDAVKLRTSIETALQFPRIIGILDISFRGLLNLTTVACSKDVPKEYHDFLNQVFLREGLWMNRYSPRDIKIKLIAHLSSKEEIKPGATNDTWFIPTVDDIITERIADMRELVGPYFDAKVLEHVDYLLSQLTTREAEVLKYYFGICGCPKTSLEQIAPKFDLTDERTRQIKEKALRRSRARKDILLHPLPQPAPAIELPHSTPLESLGLTVRVMNALAQLEVKTVEELIVHRDSLLAYRNMGMKSKQEIDEALNKFLHPQT